MVLTNPDSKKVLHPKDSTGQRCGLDDGVKNKQYLMHFYPTKCVLHSSPISTSECPRVKVCVSECPKKYFTFNRMKTFNDTINDLYCTHGTKEKLLSMESIKNAVNNGECAAWYVPSQLVGKRCLPVSINNSTLPKEPGDEMDEAAIVQNDTNIVELFLENMETNWPWIVALLLLTEVVSIIYLVLLQFFAYLMLWMSVCAVVGFDILCIYACYKNYDELSETYKSFYLGLLITLSVAMLIILLMLLFLRKRVNLAIELIKEGSRAVTCLKSTLAFPVIGFALGMIFVAWSMAVFTHLLSSFEETYRCDSNENQPGELCDPSNPPPNCGNCTVESFKYKDYVPYFLALNVFGSLWGLNFVSDFCDMILAGAFATWYWTFKKEDVPYSTSLLSIKRTVCYHLGTVAFGSFIISLCQFIRLVLEYINEKLGKFDNSFVNANMWCLSCCFRCLETFIKIINRNAYIICAIHGRNFCHSARTAYNLIMRNILRAVVLDQVTDFILILGILAITLGITALSFYVFRDQNKTFDNHNIITILIVAIFSFYIAYNCFDVHRMAVNTLFLCFLEDLERNDGSSQKPYYMSKKTLQILGKRNTRG